MVKVINREGEIATNKTIDDVLITCLLLWLHKRYEKPQTSLIPFNWNELALIKKGSCFTREPTSTMHGHQEIGTCTRHELSMWTCI